MTLKITPTNSENEEEGSWGEYRGVKLLVARANNNKFKREFKRLSAPHRRAIQKGKLDEETANSIVVRSAAVGLLRGWKNFIVDGKEVEFSLKNAIDLLKSDPDCLDYIQEFADDVDNYIIDEIEDLSKE
jgi:hypothetical protein